MPRRSSPTSPLAVLLLMGLGLGLAGCVPSDPPVTSPPTSDAEPVFASDEEALAAAEEAYGAYLATVDAIFADGGQNPDRLRSVASSEQYESELVGFEEMVNGGLRGTGTVSFELTLQSYDGELGEVTAYSCDDISDTDVVNAQGTSVVSGSRQVLIPYEITFAGTPMLVVERTIWQGGGVCE